MPVQHFDFPFSKEGLEVDRFESDIGLTTGNVTLAALSAVNESDVPLSTAQGLRLPPWQTPRPYHDSSG